MSSTSLLQSKIDKAQEELSLLRVLAYQVIQAVAGALKFYYHPIRI